MNCSECGRGHAVEGQVLVDGLALPPSFVEIMVEIACKHKLLVPREARVKPRRTEPTGEAAMVEPDHPLP